MFVRRVIGTSLALVWCAPLFVTHMDTGAVSRMRQCNPVTWATASHCDSLHVHDEPIVNNGPTHRFLRGGVAGPNRLRWKKFGCVGAVAALG